VVFNTESTELAEGGAEGEKFAWGWGARDVEGVDCDETMGNFSSLMYAVSSTFLISFE